MLVIEHVTTGHYQSRAERLDDAHVDELFLRLHLNVQVLTDSLQRIIHDLFNPYTKPSTVTCVFIHSNPNANH